MLSRLAALRGKSRISRLCEKRRFGTFVEERFERLAEGRERQKLCNILPHKECSECPFVTCDNHPQFYLVLQCAEHWRELHKLYGMSSSGSR